MSQNPVTAQPGSLSDYYGAAQLRADRWGSLRETRNGWRAITPGGKATPRHVSTALNLLESLAPIEMYWAFPGHAAFEHLQRLLASKHFDDLS
jgi:arginine decarboxylase